jgi:thiamine-phosphate pyrophosphorylase
MKSYKAAPDYSLCAITARRPGLGRSSYDIAKGAIDGGATVIQFRDKEIEDEEFVEEAKRIGRLAKDNGILFIINDRAVLAKKCGADGVHLGQADLDVYKARKIIGPNAIIGVSASGLSEALGAEMSGASYLGVGPVFETGSKHDAGCPIGLDKLGEVCRKVNIPVIAIGGITLKNASSVMASGATGIAVIAAIADAKDMRRAAEELKRKVNINVAIG